MKACRIEEYLPLDEELEMADETKFMICSADHYILKIRIYIGSPDIIAICLLHSYPALLLHSYANQWIENGFCNR